jgi:hypothetical protein
MLTSANYDQTVQPESVSAGFPNSAHPWVSSESSKH